MQPWHGAVLVGPDIQWRVLLTDVDQLADGSWMYTYSFRPGRSCYFIVRPGPAMVDPHDDTFATLARDIGASYPASAR